MKQNYLASLRQSLSILFLAVLVFAAKPAQACHGVAILGLTFNTTPTGVTIDGQSDAATCGCGPYFMQAEVTCNSSLFLGTPPTTYTDPSWGSYPWFHSILNIPGYAAPWTDQCAVEPYTQMFIPFSGGGLCPGTTYYVRVREMPDVGTPGPWSTAYTFTTPGSPPVLTATVGSNQYTACIGDQVQLNSSVSGGCTGTYNYTWSPASGLSNPNIANPVATVSGPITYTCTVTDQCVGTPISDTVGINIGAPPVAGVASVSPLSVCSGQSASVILSGYNGSIQWQVSPNGVTWFNVPGGTNDTLLTGPVSSSLYFQAIVAGTGCGTSTSNITIITVNPAPAADAGLNTTICVGASATLTGSGGTTYNWMPGSLSGSSVTVSPTSTTTYTVTVTDNNGCTATDQVTVNTSAITASAGPDVSICSGSQGTLIVSSPGASTYSWAPSSGLSNTTISNPVANPSSTTTYTVITTNSNGCTASDTITVNVTPAPPVVAGNDTIMCTGGTATLTATGATTYTWQPGNQNGATITVSPSTTTTYIVTGDNGGCLDVDTVVVNINPPPAAFAGPDFGICAGNQGTLNATGGSAYSWAPNAGIIGSPNQANITVAPTTTTTYTVSVIGVGGCISTDQIVVTVNPNPSVTATAGTPTICTGGSSGLTASGAVAYTWSPSNGLSSTSVSNPTANPTTTTTYTVIGVNSNGCSDTDMVTVTVIPTPVITGFYSTPTLCGDTTGTIVLGSIAGGVGPYTYTLNGNPVTPNNSTISALNQGSYTVQVTDAYGCTSNITTSVGVDFTQLSINGSASPLVGVAPQPVNFGSQTGGGINNIIWDFGDGSTPVSGSSPSHTYGAPGVYTIIVMGYNDILQCTTYDTLMVEIFPEAIVIPPNVFTPNQDLINDQFLATLQGVKDVKYTIYNRWGQLVKEVQGVTSGWDGKTDSGNDAPDGVYYYIIEATGFDDNVKTITGFVQLIRG